MFVGACVLSVCIIIKSSHVWKGMRYDKTVFGSNLILFTIEISNSVLYTTNLKYMHVCIHVYLYITHSL